GDALGRDYMTVHPSAQVSETARLVPPVVVGPNAVIEAGVRVGSLAVIGAGARVGEGSVVEHAVVQAGGDPGSGCLALRSVSGGLSVQFHQVKAEGIDVGSGRVEFTMSAPGDAVPHKEVVGPGAAFHVTPGVVHRMRAVEDSMLLEVSTPQLDDVVRLEDVYGR